MRTLVSCIAVALVASVAAQVTFTSVIKGDRSGQQLARQVTIRTPSEWKALWKDHAPTEAMPTIDFGKSMVVGVFLGTKPSAGHEVEIVAVRHEGKDLVVEHVQKQPPPGSMTAQILTEPYHLVSVPKHDGPVRFIHVPDTRNPKPPSSLP